MRVYVYHATKPTWDDQAAATFPEGFRRVATVEVANALGDVEAAEHAFFMTQSLDGPWPALRAEGGVTAHADYQGTSGPAAQHRSTSVGDVVIVSTDSGARTYRCSTVGWRRIQPIEVAS